MPTSHETMAVLQMKSAEPDAGVAERLRHTSASPPVADIGPRIPCSFRNDLLAGNMRSAWPAACGLKFSPHHSLSPALCLLPVLWKCVFVSSYDDRVSEVTSAASIHVRPASNVPHKTVLKFGAGRVRQHGRGMDGHAAKATDRDALGRPPAETGLEVQRLGPVSKRSADPRWACSR